MKVIIAGGRNITSVGHVRRAIGSSNFTITEVISGGAKGVDKLGEDFAKAAGIDLAIFPANWAVGKKAGPVRNMRMARYAMSDVSKKGGLIAIWDGVSKGTKSMIDIATTLGLKVFIYRIDE
jgi:hypothetical protein